jgi:hypothetical protein
VYVCEFVCLCACVCVEKKDMHTHVCEKVSPSRNVIYDGSLCVTMCNKEYSLSHLPGVLGFAVERLAFCDISQG